MPDATPAEHWTAQFDACRRIRDKFVKDVWQTNVAFRVQKPFSQSSDDDADASGVDQISVPADWSRTRSKSAALFSQLPRVSLGPAQARYATAAPTFEKIVNHFTPRSGLASVMEELCADVVNASGICAGMMKYEATFEQVQMPQQDPMLTQLAQSLGMPPPEPTMVPVTRTVSERYRAYRISPAQLLWPVEFRGSDWQRARWLGYDGVLPWAVARDEFKLKDEDKRDVCQSYNADVTMQTLGGDITREVSPGEEFVRFCEVFYWAHLVNPDEKRFEAIRRIVYIKGKAEPVVDEDYAGQKWVAEVGQFIGCTRLPIEVQTLSYVSDKAIPPSDSEIGRPMVLEQIRSRSQMILQRTRNLPIRTFDVNRIDPQISDLLMRGIWQGMIPTNGPGDRVLTQVAAAAFPREDFSFDAVSNRDLDDAWSMSPNQMGAFNTGDRSASEANLVASAYASVIGYQRTKMVGLFLGLVETLMGLLQLNLDEWEAEPIVGPDGVKKLQSWDRSKIAGKFVATIRQDASVLQDSQARANQLMKFLNLTGKSGRVKIDPIIAELAALYGLDPAEVMLPPPQPKNEDPNISFRFAGTEDLHDPITVAMLIKSGQAPGPQEIAAAKKLIADAMTMLPPEPPPQPGPPQLAAGPAAPSPQGLLPPPADWQAMERVTKRPDELGG